MSWPYIISICSLLFCCFSFLYFRSYINKRTSYEGTIKKIREEVNRLLHDIDEITDRNISLVEDREKQLKELLEETGKRLAVLNREFDRRDNAEKTYRQMGKNSVQIIETVQPEIKPPDPEPVLSLEEQIRELVRSGFPAPV
ncbi:MAG: Atg14 domain-containing protein, partial [Treponema sp.]|nr:Atg14 domain-containing protein [Treponema sp.]